MTPRTRIGYTLAALGVLWVLSTIAVEVTLHIRGLVELPPHLVYASLTAGAVVGWWGFFWVDSKRAKDGGTFVLDARERFHAHRRATDAAPDAEVIAVAPAPTQPVAPTTDEDTQ